MTPNNLKKQVREILTKLDKGGYLDGRGVEEAEQAIYDLMLEVVSEEEYLHIETEQGIELIVPDETANSLRQLIKEARNDKQNA